MNKHKEIIESKEFKAYIKAKAAITWPLTIIMMTAYYLYILIIAFFPSIFAITIGTGITTVGIYSGLGLIFFTFLITGVYVHYTNKILEPLLEKIHSKFERPNND
jgi:uncharacterized membrane protein (DUF485 family)